MHILDHHVAAGLLPGEGGLVARIQKLLSLLPCHKRTFTIRLHHLLSVSLSVGFLPYLEHGPCFLLQ